MALSALSGLSGLSGICEAPSASFNTDAPQTAGTEVTFTDTSIYPNGSWSWNFGDDSGTSTEQNPTYTYSSPGTYTVTLAIDFGASSASQTITITSVTSFIWQEVDISSYFNDIGILVDGDGGLGSDGSGLDGDGPGSGGNVVSGTALSANYPAPVSVNGVQFVLPSNYTTNNVVYANGQTITLPGGQYDYIYMLGFATNGNQTDQVFTVNYSDSSTVTFNQGFSDWFNYSSFSNETIALGGSGNLYRDNTPGNGGGTNGPIYIYEYSFAIDRTKNAISITFPNTSNTVYIFSITVASAIALMNMWVAGNSLSTSLSNGDQVSSWTDLSGNNNNPVQLNGSLQPVFVTNVVNGYPALPFTGSSQVGDSFTAGTYLSCTVNPGETGNFTVVSVFKRTGSGQASVAIGWGGNDLSNNFWQGYVADDSGSDHPGALVVGSNSNNDIYTGNIDDSYWHIAEAIFNGSYLAGWDAGTPGTGDGAGSSGNENGAATPLPSNALTIGCYCGLNLFWNGYIAEIMIFPSAISDSDRSVVESYLEYKYGLS